MTALRHRPKKLPSRPKNLPAWLEATLSRLDFLSSRYRNRGKRKLLVELLTGLKADGCQIDGAEALFRYLSVLIDRLEAEAAAREDFASALDDIRDLCRLGRIGLAGDLDDRPLLVRSQQLEGRSGAAFWAVRVPGRAVWLAAMVFRVPSEVKGAASMLVSDVAAVNMKLLFAALEAALLNCEATPIGQWKLDV